jgi:hypothetical protein
VALLLALLNIYPNMNCVVLKKWILHSCTKAVQIWTNLKEIKAFNKLKWVFQNKLNFKSIWIQHKLLEILFQLHLDWTKLKQIKAFICSALLVFIYAIKTNVWVEQSRAEQSSIKGLINKIISHFDTVRSWGITLFLFLFSFYNFCYVWKEWPSFKIDEQKFNLANFCELSNSEI